MAFELPDVFVSVDIPEPNPTVTSPGLMPCVVGEHYYVAKDEFVASVSPGDSGPWAYPGLPDSSNDSATKLSVDTTSDFAPTFTLVAGDGTETDITDEIDASGPTPSEFELSGSFPHSGSLFVSYRARDDQYAGTEQALLQANSFSDLTNFFGEEGVGPANPLGYAMYQMMQHSNLSVTGVAVTNPSSSGGTYSDPISNVPGAYTEALQFLRKQDVYTVVPLTENELVHSLVESHVDYMTDPGGGNQERLTVLAPQITGTDVVRRSDNFTPWYPINDGASGTDLSDAFSSESVGAEIELGGFRIVKTASSSYYIRGYVPSANGTGETVTLDGTDYEVLFNGLMLAELDNSAISPPTQSLESSDDFEFQADDGTTVTTSIQSLPIPQHEKVIEVDAGSAAPVDARPWQAVRTTDPQTERQAFIDLYKSKARSVNNERVVMVMPNWVGDIDAGFDIPSYYAAAQLSAEFCRTSEEPAGAAPGVEPLFGLRDSTEHTFRSSRFFTPSELQEIAGAGWTILANDRIGDNVNTLQTVTTDASSVERMEAILVVERDYLSRFFRDEMSDSLREFRITGRTLNLLSLQAGEVASTLSDPQSQHYRYQDVSVESVRQSESDPDTVIYEVSASHLYPYNQGEVRATIVT